MSYLNRASKRFLTVFGYLIIVLLFTYTKMINTWYELKELAITDLEERWDERGSEEYIHDLIHEIAYSMVPCYNWELLQLALDNIRLATSDPELGTAFNGCNTPTNLIASNVYEFLVEAMYKRFNENQNQK